MKVIYILSQPKGGSTLLSFLLNAHPKLFTVGETARTFMILSENELTNHKYCSCGKKFSECEFWLSVISELKAKGWNLEHLRYLKFTPYNSKILNTLLLRSYYNFNQDKIDKLLNNYRLNQLLKPIFKPRKIEIESFYYDFLSTVSNIMGTIAYVDNSKSPVFLPIFNSFNDLDLRVINLTRDGRAVVHSWATRSTENFKSLSEVQQVEKWIRGEIKRNLVLSHLDVTSITVKYEELAKHPKKELKRILNYIELDPIDYPINNFKTGIEHHMTGNLMRLNNNEDIKIDERWKKEISPSLLNEFINSKACDINKLLGYE